MAVNAPRIVDPVTNVAWDTFQFVGSCGLIYSGSPLFVGVGTLSAYSSGTRLANVIWRRGDLPATADLVGGALTRTFPRLHRFIDTHKENVVYSSLSALAGYAITTLPVIGSAVSYATWFTPTAMALISAGAAWVIADAEQLRRPQAPAQPPAQQAQQRPFPPDQRRRPAPTTPQAAYGGAARPVNLLTQQLSQPFQFQSPDGRLSRPFYTIHEAYEVYRQLLWEAGTYATAEDLSDAAMFTIVQTALLYLPQVFDPHLENLLAAQYHRDFAQRPGALGAIFIQAARDANLI